MSESQQERDAIHIATSARPNGDMEWIAWQQRSVIVKLLKEILDELRELHAEVRMKESP